VLELSVAECAFRFTEEKFSSHENHKRIATESQENPRRFKGEDVMTMKKLILLFTALIVGTLMVTAQDQTQAQPDKVIKHVPVKTTSPVSGKEMFTSYCAVCHGTDGKGGGPAASALKTPPTDLTTLSKNNGGKFPSLKVEASIRGESALPAHGSKDMPIWGTLFATMSGGHEGEVQQRVTNLTKYIESLQVK
jgi:mono/diheme cytochrome c family protein